MASSERKNDQVDEFAIVRLNYNNGNAYRYYQSNKPRFNADLLTRELKRFRCDSSIFQVRLPAKYLKVARANLSSGVSSDIYNPNARTVGTVSVRDDGTDFATTLMAFFNAHNLSGGESHLNMTLSFTDGRIVRGVTRVSYVEDRSPELDCKTETFGEGESKTHVPPLAPYIKLPSLSPEPEPASSALTLSAKKG